MSKTLGASMFGYNLESMDYSWRESILCMKEFADKIVIVDAGSTDGTDKLMEEYEDEKTTVICLPNKMWQMSKFYQKVQLSYFSNIASSLLDTDYFFSCQADEVLHENSYEPIRRAIETGNEGFLVKRVNLWKDCFHQLNVPQERKPCSSEVIRLAKRGYGSFDDAENLCVQCVPDFVNDITIVHYGFVRKKEIMPKKIRHMLGEVFQMGVDEKLNGMEIFDSSKWFTDEDLLPFNEHPKLMQEWIKTRP